VAVNRSSTQRTVQMTIGPATEEMGWTNLLDPNEVSLSQADATKADGRPTLAFVQDGGFAAIERGGKITITLEPWGSAILVEPHTHLDGMMN
jgi:hypothetical protein